MKVTNIQFQLEPADIKKPAINQIQGVIIMNAREHPLMADAKVVLKITSGNKPGFGANITNNDGRLVDWGNLAEMLVRQGPTLYCANVSGRLEMVGPGTPLYSDQPGANRPKEHVLLLDVSDINIVSQARIMD